MLSTSVTKAIRLRAYIALPSFASLVSELIIVGASFVPVTVTLTVRSTLPPWPSRTVMVKLSTFCWPSARYSTASAATL